MQKPRVIVEVSQGKVWWVCGTAEVDVLVMNHDDGKIYCPPIESRNEEYVDEKFELGMLLNETGMTAIDDETVRKLEEVAPNFYKKWKELLHKQQ